VRGVLRDGQYAEGDLAVEHCQPPRRDQPVMWGDAPAHTYLPLPVSVLALALLAAGGFSSYQATWRVHERWVRERVHVAQVDPRKGALRIPPRVPSNSAVASHGQAGLRRPAGHLGIELDWPRRRLLGQSALVITSLDEQDLVWRAGLRPADLLLEVDGAPVLQDPAEAIARMQQQAIIELRYVSCEGAAVPSTGCLPVGPCLCWWLVVCGLALAAGGAGMIAR